MSRKVPGIGKRGLRPLFSAFDKIAYIKSSQNTFETGKCKVVRSFSALFRQDDDAPDASSKKISDHLPLWAEFKVNELTQELNATVKRM